jgi:O-antigen/teichoic acid export membrane protein
MQFNKALKHTIIFKSLNTAFTFAINILLVRLLGADRSGQFFYAVTVLSFVTLVTGLCLENGITYYISRHPMAAMALTGYIAAALLVQAFISWFVIVQLHLSLPVTYQLLLVVSLLAINYFAALLTSRKWIVPVNSIVCAINFVTAGILCFLYFSNAHIVTINEVPVDLYG